MACKYQVWCKDARICKEHMFASCSFVNDCRDDVVFHDDFLSMFPSYWSSVPPDFHYIAVGMIPRHFNVSETAVYGKNAQALVQTPI